jgi:hypothetical protein
LIIASCADDFLVIPDNERMSAKLKRELMIQFKMEDLGDVKLCLGIRLPKDESNSVYALDQSHYIKISVDRFNLWVDKWAETPLEINLNLPKSFPMCLAKA